jgi:hypothetical protein
MEMADRNNSLINSEIIKFYGNFAQTLCPSHPPIFVSAVPAMNATLIDGLIPLPIDDGGIHCAGHLQFCQNLRPIEVLPLRLKIKIIEFYWG